MVTNTGRVTLPGNGPYVYFIVKHSYLYLGGNRSRGERMDSRHSRFSAIST